MAKRILFTLPEVYGNEPVKILGRRFVERKHEMVVPDNDKSHKKVVNLMERYYGCDVAMDPDVDEEDVEDIEDESEEVDSEETESEDEDSGMDEE